MLATDSTIRSGTNHANRGPPKARLPGYLPRQRRDNLQCTHKHTVPHVSQTVSRLCASRAETVQQLLVEIPETSRPASAADDEDLDELEAGPGPQSSGSAGPDVSFVSLVDGKYTVRGTLLLPASAAQVYGMLTDYENCHRVFRNIASSQVVRPAAGSVGLQVVQSCRWKFLAFSGTFKVQLGVSEDLDSGTLLFSLVQSNFMRDFEGRWTVRPADPPATASEAAAGDQEWCEVEHQLSVVPSVPVPPPVSYYTRSIFVRQVEGILADLQRAVLTGARGAQLERIEA
ncbi:hypothetical protein VOLCADRAFT_107511 [Volvox carteri f. nagariensis]|uniref:Coenzyme Q-binding protein COQ10 START domain-containing protein n=1 Tax=Volvox carteri f. nagariensis TaxID=3068 RepID=D8UEG8_VOLCA|nr:uncharacterized protein VOLCADRAFT_107511 [Volvox carteri f. nagariensis]EFJ41841.1 hypothetical protein VOLCADRAFT_107511 [Volvox carteri f. nagariensis]|eukprot:XP_002957039.1 hypothetical protein VOLCADRAFT_107511 [Volvox carteri f. nagariensis]